MSNNSFKLFKEVLAKSNSKVWEEAVKEWEIFGDGEEDSTGQSDCVCGKEHLVHLFTIKNSKNGNILFPIGSTCIKKFLRHELNLEVNLRMQFFKLMKAAKTRYVSLKDDGLFSRKLIELLHKRGVFDNPTYDSKRTYEFFRDMFNKKGSLLEHEQKRVDAIILNQIIPYAKKYKLSKAELVS